MKTAVLRTSFILFLLSLIGCSSSKLYETFYVGEQGIQYFVHSLQFESGSPAPGSLEMDFTFRQAGVTTDTALINISVHHPLNVWPIDSLQIYSASGRLSPGSFTLLYTERNGDLITTRFSSKYPGSALKPLFSSPDWKCVIYTHKNQYEFIPDSGTRKKIKDINYSVFSLF